MRTITIRLTDEEYGELERRALEDRRTVRQMAERLVTMPPQPVIVADWTWRPQTVPYTTPYLTSPTICDATAPPLNGLRVS
jgi:hypothetical protein